MKNKIAKKLILYFTVTLLLFSVIIGCFFVFLFSKHTTELHKQELENRAVKISQKLSDYMGNNQMNRGPGSGLGAYLKFLDDIAMSNVWIVDRNSQLITRPHGQASLSYGELPDNGIEVVRKALEGHTSFSEGFSSLLGKKSITVGTPILKDDGNVIAVVLLHAPVEGIEAAVLEGVGTLAASMIVALILSIGMAVLLSFYFIKPLKNMEATAKILASGDYTVKTGINQKDEIGDLAYSIDVLSDRLYNASQQSAKLEKMRRDFVSNISHELRTPVTVIRGSLEAICDGVVTKPGQIQEYHHQMLSETIYLQRLVNDLLDLSRLQNSDFIIEMSPLNLCDITNEVVRSMKPVGEKKRVTVKLDSIVFDYTILGDYGRLRQMLLIVLDNAIKFSPEQKLVTVSLRENGDHCTVFIINEGKGIVKDDLPYIFDRFYKTTSEQNKTGTGLGLPIAKEIAQRHNIMLTVTSEVNKETIFAFTFSRFAN